MDIRIRIGQVNGCGVKSHLRRCPFSRFLRHLHQPNGIRRGYDIRLEMAFAENHTIHKGLLQAIFRRILLHNIPILQRQHTRQNHTIAKRRQQHQHHCQRKQFPDTSNHCSLLPFYIVFKISSNYPCKWASSLLLSITTDADSLYSSQLFWLAMRALARS